MNSVTPANLGWWILAFLATGTVLNAVQEWIRDRWELTPDASWRRPLMRRWYGTHAHVRLRNGIGAARHNIFRVIAWDDEDTELPWLLVVLHNGTSWRLSEDDTGEPEPFWGRVTDFAPYTVRHVRPHILRTEHRRFPELFDYRPVRQPCGYLGKVA